MATDLTVTATASQTALPRVDNPARIHDAAQQFEALLLGQILASAHGEGGWMGSGEDAAGSCATGFAEQQLATMMARQGGLGLAKLIVKGLEGQAKAAAPAPK